MGGKHLDRLHSQSNMNALGIILFALAAFSQKTSAAYEDCGSVDGTLESVEVSNCDFNSMKACPLKRGEDAELTIKFTTNKAVDNITAVVHGILAGAPIPFILPEGGSQACSNSGLECPLAENTSYTYKAKLPVLTAYPKLHVKVKWELKSDSGTDIVCIVIPSKIV